MISKTVTQTQRFLQMPLEAQALYFHLIQNTDDDGIVEAFPVTRMIGASEDTIKLLQAKEFIRLLNEEMVYFVIDFHEQNSIQKHHYKPSRYQSLLTAEEIAQNPRITGDLKPVNEMLTESYPNISKVNLIQDNLEYIVGQNPTTEPSSDFIFPNWITEESISKLKKCNPNNYKIYVPIQYLNQQTNSKYKFIERNAKLVKARYADGYTLEDFKQVIDNKVAEWGNSTEWSKYLRPETLFNVGKFESYLNQKNTAPNQSTPSHFPEVPF